MDPLRRFYLLAGCACIVAALALTWWAVKTPRTVIHHGAIYCVASR